MKNTSPPLWIFYIFGLLGLWLITAPSSFDFDHTPLMYSDLICGVLLLAVGIIRPKRPSASLLWSIAFLGIWLEFAPLLFWAPSSGAYLINTLIGILVIVFSVILFPMPGQIPDIEPTIPPGWTYNPSSVPQRMPIALAVFICWMISRYLSAYQLGYIDAVWEPFFSSGTQKVLESDVSKLFPVSDAGLGAFAYTLEFLATCQGGKARWRTSPWGVFVFGLLVIPVSLVSAILIILQPLVVGAWCTLCLITAVFMLLPIPLAVDEVVASIQYLRQAKKGSFLRLLFKGGACANAAQDTRTPALDAPVWKLWKASFWGVSCPWNLTLSFFVGILIMIYPSYFGFSGFLFDLDPILGALIAILAVLSWSEFLRPIRLGNSALGLILSIAGCFSHEFIVLHILTGVVVVALSFRKGESYNANHSM